MKPEELARRLRYFKRKAEAARDPENTQASRDNDFLKRLGIEAVTFDNEGTIVPWKGLLCEKNPSL